MTDLDLATSREVAKVLRTTEAGLGQMRLRGTGPTFLRLSANRVLYRWSDVRAWLDARVVEGDQ